MKHKISPKTKLIILLTVLIFLIGLIPLKEIFLEPSITGAMVARVFVTSMDQNYTCNATFFQGWNLASIPCAVSNTSVNSVLSSIEGNYTSIHSYVASDPSDPWKAYNPSLPSWVVLDLTSINEKDGYWIYMDNESFFNLSGVIRIPNILPLVEGWNMIGYPVNRTKNISEALQTIDGSYNLVWSYNTTSDIYYYYNHSSGNGTLYDMELHKGYWINITNAGSLFLI